MQKELGYSNMDFRKKLTWELNNNWNNCTISLWFHNNCVLKLWGPRLQNWKGLPLWMQWLKINSDRNPLIYWLPRRCIHCSSLLQPVLLTHSEYNKHLVPLKFQSYSLKKICLLIAPVQKRFHSGWYRANTRVIKWVRHRKNVIITDFPESILTSTPLLFLMVKLEQTLSATVTPGIICVLVPQWC